MKSVKIYIYSSIKANKKSNGAAGYVLSYMTMRNGEATLSKIEYLEDMTEHEAELWILIKALSRLNTKELMIEMYTDSQYLESSISRWLLNWALSDWTTAKGEPIKYAEQWETIFDLLEGDEYCIKRQHHEYSNWLIDQCKKKGPEENGK